MVTRSACGSKLSHCNLPKITLWHPADTSLACKHNCSRSNPLTWPEDTGAQVSSTPDLGTVENTGCTTRLHGHTYSICCTRVSQLERAVHTVYPTAKKQKRQGEKKETWGEHVWGQQLNNTTVEMWFSSSELTVYSNKQNKKRMVELREYCRHANYCSGWNWTKCVLL